MFRTAEHQTSLAVKTQSRKVYKGRPEFRLDESSQSFFFCQSEGALRPETLTAPLIERAILSLATNESQRSCLISFLKAFYPISSPEGASYANFFGFAVATYTRVYSEPCFREYQGLVKGLADLPWYDGPAFLALGLHDRLIFMYYRFVYSGERDIHLCLRDLSKNLNSVDQKELESYMRLYSLCVLPGVPTSTLVVSREYTLFWFFTLLWSVWA